MQVVITTDSAEPDSLTIEEWIEIGKEDGYCEAKDIYKYQIIGIEYINDQPIKK